MPELLDRPEDSSSDDDSDDESVPDLHAAKYGIWNLEGIKSYQRKYNGRRRLRRQTDESENSIEES
jgi:hypothetical protein